MNHQENPDPVHSSGLLRFRSAPSSLFSSFDNTETKSDSVENRGQTHFSSRDFIEKYEERKPVLNGFSSNSFLNLQYPKQSSSSSSSNLMGSNLMRQGSSPAGFFSHINPQNGYGALRGVGNYRLGQGNNTASEINPSSSRLTIPSRFSSGFPPLGTLPQISETGDENVYENNEIPKFESRYQFNSWRDSSYFPDNVSVFKKELENDGKLFSSSSSQDVEIGFRGTFLSHHLSLPKTSAEIAAMDKYLHFQDTVPCKVRAKRGCATHPRSIAERVRRTRISERMRKLQELVPNMDKQTNTAEMLDLAVEYIKDLQQQYKILCENRGKCKCSSMQKSHQIL